MAENALAEDEANTLLQKDITEPEEANTGLIAYEYSPPQLA
jgi:hypothetical protein